MFIYILQNSEKLHTRQKMVGNTNKRNLESSLTTEKSHGLCPKWIAITLMASALVGHDYMKKSQNESSSHPVYISQPQMHTPIPVNNVGAFPLTEHQKNYAHQTHNLYTNLDK
jgi:hypothetical protein